MRRVFAMCVVASLFALSCLGTGGYIDTTKQCTNDGDCQNIDPAMRCGPESRCICPEKQGFRMCDVSGQRRCVLIAEDTAHCGNCGAACQEGQSCCAGTCLDLLNGDRSTTPHKHCGRCRRHCDANKTDCCDGNCRDLKRDNAHCGACGKSCDPGQSCCAGTCVDPLKGLQDKGFARHCGTCSNDCSATNPDCCNGQCTDLQADASNCGACGKVCAQGQTCCDGVCVEPTQDPKACGKCGQLCKAGEGCCDGKCVALNTEEHCGICGQKCDTGELCCGGACINPNTDNAHCASCGNSCIGAGDRMSQAQTQDGQSMVFKLTSLPAITNASPLRLSIDAYGDYDADDEYADIFVCRGDVPDCSPTSQGFIKEARISGGIPKCNTALTDLHRRVFLLSPKDLPGTTATLRVKLSDAVSAGACLAQKPRIEVSYGAKQCCARQCTDTVNFTSLLKSEHCGTCGNKCRSGEFCCQGKCARLSDDDNNCSACANECNAATRWTRQEKDGERIRFFFSANDLKGQPSPLPLKIDLFGDYADDDRYAQVTVCQGDVPTCAKGDAAFLTTYRINGGEPRCNTSLTSTHSLIKELTGLPNNTPLTVIVQLSAEVSYSACAKNSPRIVASLGRKRCCKGDCVDFQSGFRESDGRYNHCGGCGIKCESGETCCGGSCVDTSSSDDHCGACDQRCNNTPSLAAQKKLQAKDGQTFSFKLTGLAAPTAQAPLRLRFDALADFNSSGEHATIKAFVGGQRIDFYNEQGVLSKQVRLGGGSNSGRNCLHDSRIIYFTDATFSGGDLTLEVSMTLAVSYLTCATMNPYVHLYVNPESCCKGTCTTSTCTP